MSLMEKANRAKPKPKTPLKENDPSEPRPKTCPKCNGRQICAVEPTTTSGLLVWRCRKCGVTGYGRRCLGDPTSDAGMGARTTQGTYRQNLL